MKSNSSLDWHAKKKFRIKLKNALFTSLFKKIEEAREQSKA